jgi:dTDP-4-dehydrorhamnose 3,5-epimerase
MTQVHRLAALDAPHGAQIPVLLATRRHADSRGWFSESYSERALAKHDITCGFVQDNQSMSRRRGTIRGLHFQLPPMAQAKLVRAVRGSILDIAVDIRRDSPSFGRFVAAELSADNGLQLFVPVGFAHGFCTLEDDTEVAYKVSEFYSPEHDAGIHWDDPEIAVPWPVDPGEITVSDKDAGQPTLAQFRGEFSYHGEPLTPLLIRG